jgi:hypothetical protein
MTDRPRPLSFQFPERFITRHDPGLVERRLVPTLIVDPQNGQLMVDLRAWQRDVRLSAGELHPTTEAVTMTATDWPTLDRVVRALIANHQGKS